ncbi:unnamed protein product [Caenorhabditis auriculariae]|uniref:Glycosyl hydrolase family 63 C-terminal domain-containing protein n=1 Tax=Caenorhabditis auriculariae TaxID=2777116 RepID=A0A8S1GVP1_9PELO|nr:unnamed protein product [Caenorhabditis auriculariae]
MSTEEKKGGKEDSIKKEDSEKRDKKLEKESNEAANLKKWLFIGLPTTVIFAVLVQLLINKFYTIPLNARTLKATFAIDIDEDTFGIYDPEKIFELRKAHPDSIQFGIKVARNASEDWGEDSVSELDWYQWEIGDARNFGKQLFQGNHVSGIIRWVRNDATWKVQLEFSHEKIVHEHLEHAVVIYFQTKNASDSFYEKEEVLIWKGENSEDGKVKAEIKANGSSRHLLRSENGKQEAKFIFESSLALELVFAAEGSTSNESFTVLFEKQEKDFDKKFQAGYLLSNQNLPTFYQSMGKSALANVLNSQFYIKEVTASSQSSSSFRLDVNWTGVLSSRENFLSSFDDQTFPLLTILNYDAEFVQDALSSWLQFNNKLDESANRILENRIPLFEKPQTLLVFYLLHAMSKKPEYKNFLLQHQQSFCEMARTTFEQSVSYEKNRFTWNSGYGFENSTSRNTSIASFELHCLLEIVAKSVVSIADDAKVTEEFRQKLDELRNQREKYWDNEEKSFTDLFWSPSKKESHIAPEDTYSKYLPLIFKMLPPDSTQLKIMLNRLGQDENWTEVGLRTSEKGAPLVINYLLLGALKHYAGESSPVQYTSHLLYSQLKNKIISYVAREFKRTHMFFEYYDANGVGSGTRAHNSASVILLVMAEIYY